MKKIIVLTILLSVLWSTSCKKEDLTDKRDITLYSWKLKCVTTENKTQKPKERDYLREDAYLLVFDTDSMFRLHTSVNYAYGVYEILAKGEIKIEYYGEATEAGEIDDKVQKFNETLVSTMNGITTYKVLGNTLILEGAKGKVEFEK